MSETAVEINDRINNMYRNRMKMDFLSDTLEQVKKNITSNGQCLFSNDKNAAALNSKLKNLPQYWYNQTDSFERPQCKETYRGNDEELTPFCETPFGQTICDAVRDLQKQNTLSNITSITTVNLNTANFTTVNFYYGKLMILQRTSTALNLTTANTTEAVAPESSTQAISSPTTSATDERQLKEKIPKKDSPNQGARQLANIGNATNTNPEANSSSSKITSILPSVFIYAIYTFL